MLDDHDDHDDHHDHHDNHQMKKKRKDPNAPKKPPTAYLLYSNYKRNELKHSHPMLGPKEIMAEIGQGWKLLDDSSKIPYENEAKRAKEQYDRDLAIHKSNEMLASSSSSSSLSSYHNMPTYNVRKSALEFYFDARREKVSRQFPNATLNEQNAILRQKFDQMSAERRQKYLDLESMQRSVIHHATTGQQSV
jgi:hypothetical protein